MNLFSIVVRKEGEGVESFKELDYGSPCGRSKRNLRAAPYIEKIVRLKDIFSKRNTLENIVPRKDCFSKRLFLEKKFFENIYLERIVPRKGALEKMS